MELEMKLMWCKGLTSFNFFQKLTVYAAVSITTENEKIQLTNDQKQEQKTSVDDDGDGNPEWNHSMKFDLRPLNSINPNNLVLKFELRNHGQLFGDKTIGEVRVPLTELIQSVGCDVVRFVSYEVRCPQGKHNGILDFSYKVIGKNHNNNNTISSIHDIPGYHHHHHHHYLQLDGNNTNSDTGYHQHSQLDGNNSNSDNHVIGYHHHHHSEDYSISDSEKIQYPKIDLEEHSAPPLVYPPPTLYPPPPPHYLPPLPPPPPQIYVYPPPPPRQQQPYGDPHWMYQWPPDDNHW